MYGLFSKDGESGWKLYYIIELGMNFEFEMVSWRLKAVLGLHFSKATVLIKLWKKQKRKKSTKEYPNFTEVI